MVYPLSDRCIIDDWISDGPTTILKQQNDEWSKDHWNSSKIGVPTVWCDQFRWENVPIAQEISDMLDIGQKQFSYFLVAP